MLTYKAIYKFLEECVYGEVLDFPGTISFAEDLGKTRRSLANALVEMAEVSLSKGESLPKPDASITNSETDLEELRLAYKCSPISTHYERPIQIW
jgi:predicted RNase H-like HicB family nuclease